MKLPLLIDNARLRLTFWVRSESFPDRSYDRNDAAQNRNTLDDIDSRYRIAPLRDAAHSAAGMLPPAWREQIAERLLRRQGAPGPASEHVFQYCLGSTKRRQKSGRPQENNVAKGADIFYERQYRQYLNPVMGAFAMTATQALLAAGGPPSGLLWRRIRKTFAAMLEDAKSGLPILVISRQTVAVPILLPNPGDDSDRNAATRWMRGSGVMPLRYRRLIEGEEVNCAEPNVRARERGEDGARLELLDSVIKTGKLALLVLHPHDPDAMGLHITLFGVKVLEPDQFESDYGLPSSVLDAYRMATSENGRRLIFCVGGTEEVFTQCSQNLFVKRAAAPKGARARPVSPHAWSPQLPLERLLNAQFETFQVTVSASGLPGASPRNANRGKAAFVARRRGKTVLLIPYHPGNFIHGHAAKLWSNKYGSLTIFDDHTALTAVTISGPARVLSHETVERDFPHIARESAGQKPNGVANPNPEYWYLQEVVELVQQTEFLAANSLDPQRPTCSISAGGSAKHDKKPAYFAANSLHPYNMNLQHEREAAGRPVDPSGREHRQWSESIWSALHDRRSRLDSLSGRDALNPAPPPAHPAG